jgi:hypothetical protein
MTQGEGPEFKPQYCKKEEEPILGIFSASGCATRACGSGVCLTKAPWVVMVWWLRRPN